MTHNRFLIFAWNLSGIGELSSTGNPLKKIKASCETFAEAKEKAKEFCDLNNVGNFYDFIIIFDCRKRLVVKEYDNIPF